MPKSSIRILFALRRARGPALRRGGSSRGEMARSPSTRPPVKRERQRERRIRQVRLQGGRWAGKRRKACGAVALGVGAPRSVT